MTHPLTPKSNELIIDNQPQFGWLSRPIDIVNYQDFDLRSPMGRKRSWLSKKMGFNQFHFIGVVSPRYILGCAIVDIKWMGNAFFYLYDLETNQLYERSFLLPLARGADIALTPDRGVDYFRQGENLVEMTAEDQPRQRRLRVQFGTEAEVDITLREPQIYQPLVVCTRTGASGWTYTQKATALEVQGKIRIPGKTFEVNSETDLASYDWSCGYLRRETNWNWGCLSGFSTDGRKVGINVATGVNETSLTENCFWVDGELHKLEGVYFDYDRSNLLAPWRLSTRCGSLDLSFSSMGLRQERVNALVLATDFKQPFGHFSGSFRPSADSAPITLDRQPGFTEEHYAKW